MTEKCDEARSHTRLENNYTLKMRSSIKWSVKGWWIGWYENYDKVRREQ